MQEVGLLQIYIYKIYLFQATLQEVIQSTKVGQLASKRASIIIFNHPKLICLIDSSTKYSAWHLSYEHVT